MKVASVRALKHEMSTVLNWVAAGETVEVRRRNQPVAILAPPKRRPPIRRPDFAKRLKDAYGATILEVTGTALVSDARGRT